MTLKSPKLWSLAPIVKRLEGHIPLAVPAVSIPGVKFLLLARTNSAWRTAQHIG